MWVQDIFGENDFFTYFDNIRKNAEFDMATT